jgi:hypothetical protein
MSAGRGGLPARAQCERHLRVLQEFPCRGLLLRIEKVHPLAIDGKAIRTLGFQCEVPRGCEGCATAAVIVSRVRNVSSPGSLGIGLQERVLYQNQQWLVLARSPGPLRAGSRLRPQIRENS